MSVPGAVSHRQADGANYCEACGEEGPDSWSFPVEGVSIPMCAPCIEKYCDAFCAEYDLIFEALP